jgi:hypothetical protein
MKNMLVIDGKNNSKPNLESLEDKKSSEETTVQNYRRGPTDRLARGKNFETREHLENLLSQRDQKLRNKSDSGCWITDPEEQQSSD